MRLSARRLVECWWASRGSQACRCHCHWRCADRDSAAQPSRRTEVGLLAYLWPLKFIQGYRQSEAGREEDIRRGNEAVGAAAAGQRLQGAPAGGKGRLAAAPPSIAMPAPAQKSTSKAKIDVRMCCLRGQLVQALHPSELEKEFAAASTALSSLEFAWDSRVEALKQASDTRRLVCVAAMAMARVQVEQLAIRGSTLPNFVPVLISHKQNLLLQLSDTRSAVVKESALTIAIIFKVPAAASCSLCPTWPPGSAPCATAAASAQRPHRHGPVWPPTSRQPEPPPPPLRECIIEAFKPIVGVKIISHSVHACSLSSVHASCVCVCVCVCVVCVCVACRARCW